MKYTFEHVVGLRSPSKRLAERWRSDRHDHELLEVNAVIGVRATVEHVHHWYWKNMSVGSADVAVERHLHVCCCGFCNGKTGAKNRICAKTTFVVGAIEFDQFEIDCSLIDGIPAGEAVGNLGIDVVDRCRHTFAEVSIAAVT